MISPTIVHQVLHGYAEGHKLLASSMDLPSATRRQMLLLSDLSGSAMVDGFEEYLTGYPVPEIASYALARTWYASEMKRPGCVWTHTLLLSFDYLNLVTMPSQLTYHFCRPSGSYEKYKSPILLKSDPAPSSVPSGATNFDVVLASLYSQLQPVVVASSSALQYEDIVARIWCQQWERLKRNFTFCTGALSPRFFDTKAFDLQITATSTMRLFGRGHEAFLTVTSQDFHVSKAVPHAWVRVAKESLLSSGENSLSSFLRKYGAGTYPSRASFVPLVQTYIATRKTYSSEEGVFDRYKNLISEVCSYFPEAQDAISLKQDLFGENVDPLLYIARDHEGIFLWALAKTHDHDALDPAKVHIRERAKKYASESPHLAGQLLSELVTSSVSPIGEDILVGILEGITAEKVLEISVANPKIIPLFVSRYPVLATNQLTWSISPDLHFSILDALKLQSSINWQLIMPAIIDANATDILGDVLLEAGFAGVEVLLEYLESSVALGKAPSKKWLASLTNHKPSVLKWLHERSNISPVFLLTLIDIFDPASMAELSDITWLGMTRVLQQHSLPNELRVGAFLLAGAFIKHSTESAIIASVTFQIVHDAQHHNLLSNEAWRWLDPVLPQLSADRWWDKCEKLREGYVNYSFDYQWPISLFLAGLSDEDTFRFALEYCRSRRDGKEIFKSIKDEMMRSPSTGYEFQRKIVLEKHWLKRLLG